MTRAATAQTLMDKLDSGGKVSRRDLVAALGEAGIEEYERRWAAELDRRKYFEQKPDEIKKYEALVHEGDFLANRATGATGNTAIKMGNMAEAKYERAIEYLQEIVERDSSLRHWFDRDLSFGIGTSLGIDADSVARTVTSNSVYKLNAGMAKKYSKEEIKRELLREAIESGGVWAQREITVAQKDALKDKLKKLMKK